MRPAYGSIYYRYQSPGCFLWAQILDDTGRLYIRASLKFVREDIPTLAQRLKERTAALGIPKLRAIYAHPEMFDTETGAKKGRPVESPAQVFRRFGIPLQPGPTHEAHSWQRVHDFLRTRADGLPWLVVSPEATAIVRTLPSIVQKDGRPEEAEGDLYAAHALRLLLASQPSPGYYVPPKEPPAYLTVGWLKSLDAPRENEDDRVLREW